MFTDESLETVSVESVWRKCHQQERHSRSCQTLPLKTAEAAAQSQHRSESSTQTDPDDKHTHGVLHANEPDAPGLQEFLHRVEGVVIRELIKNSKSHAFDGFEVNWENQSETVSCIHSLSFPEAQERRLHVTSLSWSSSGSVIACAFGRMDDGDWSTEKSFMCTWNLDLRCVDPKRPHRVIDVATAVTSLCFHPARPSLIAGGLYTGEVVVWDNSTAQDPVLAQTGLSADAHREPVCQVRWVAWGRKGELAVLSACTGGRVLLWSLQDSTLVPRVGFALLREQIPMRSLVAKIRGSSSVGVTSLALSPWDPDMFLLGSEGGLVLKCSFSAQTPAAVHRDSESISLRAPAQFCFSPRCGPIHALHCSPFHRNLFLSVGTDGFAHLHSLLQPDPLLSLKVSDSYVFGAHWSPSRPLVFAVATGEGSVQIFDLGKRSLKPVETIDQKSGGQPVYCLEFNPQQTHLLAVGNANGTINIWHLRSELTDQGPKEAAQLEQLANEAAEWGR